MTICFKFTATNTLDELNRRDQFSIENSIANSGLLQNSTAPVNIPGSPMSNSISGLLQGSSAPVNIPTSTLGNFSPTNHSSLFPDAFSHISGSAPKLNNSYNPSESLFFQSHIMSPGLAELSISPDLR